MVHTKSRIPISEDENISVSQSETFKAHNLTGQIDTGNHWTDPRYNKTDVGVDQEQLQGVRQFLNNRYYVDNQTAYLELFERPQSNWAERILPFLVIGGVTAFYLFGG